MKSLKKLRQEALDELKRNFANNLTDINHVTVNGKSSPLTAEEKKELTDYAHYMSYLKREDETHAKAGELTCSFSMAEYILELEDTLKQMKEKIANLERASCQKL